MTDDPGGASAEHRFGDGGGAYGDHADLTTLLAYRRPSAISVWVDPVSPATGLFLPYLDIDGHAHGGRPWRFRGHHEVELRLLPEADDPFGQVVAQCILAVRAWAVLRGAGDELIPMEYDVPWGYLFHLQRDLRSLRELGLPHLVATAGRDGEWLGNWVSEYFDSPEVRAAVDKDRAAANALSISNGPSVMVRGTIFRAEEMPDDVDVQIEQLLSDDV